jgi:hypothetical protein
MSATHVVCLVICQDARVHQHHEGYSCSAAIADVSQYASCCKGLPSVDVQSCCLCCFLLQDLHMRLQPLLVFTIDGANYIDAADTKWEIVAAVMHTEGKQQQLVGVALSDCRLMSSAQQLWRSLLLARSQISVIRLLCCQHVAGN